MSVIPDVLRYPHPPVIPGLLRYPHPPVIPGLSRNPKVLFRACMLSVRAGFKPARTDMDSSVVIR
jgi:hypothetical protein